MTIYIGLDAHSTTSTFVSLDGDGKLLDRCRVDTCEKNFLAFVRRQKGNTKLAVEETNIAQWVYALLNPEVDELIVCNATYLGKRQGPKDDFRDALRLAQELRCGHVTPVYHDESRMMELRRLVSGYLDITLEIARIKNRYKALYRAEGLPAKGQAIYSDIERIKEFSSHTLHFVAENTFAQITQLEELKERYLAVFGNNMKKYWELKRLDSIPGIDCVRTHIIAAVICSAARFRSKHQLWAYAMLVKYDQDSDGTSYGLKSVQGRRELKCTFQGIAECILQGQTSLRKYYDRLRTVGLNHDDAKMALARKVAAICLAVLKNNKDYDDKWEVKKTKSDTKRV